MKHEHRDATLQLLTKRLQTHSLLTFLASSSLPAALTSPLPNVTEISKCKTRAIFSLPGTRVLKPLFWFFSAGFTEGQSKERGHKDGVDKDISSFVIMFILTCGLLGVMVIVTVAVNIYRKKKINHQKPKSYQHDGKWTAGMKCVRSVLRKTNYFSCSVVLFKIKASIQRDVIFIL